MSGVAPRRLSAGGAGAAGLKGCAAASRRARGRARRARPAISAAGDHDGALGEAVHDLHELAVRDARRARATGWGSPSASSTKTCRRPRPPLAARGARRRGPRAAGRAAAGPAPPGPARRRAVRPLRGAPPAPALSRRAARRRPRRAGMPPLACRAGPRAGPAAPRAGVEALGPEAQRRGRDAQHVARRLRTTTETVAVIPGMQPLARVVDADDRVVGDDVLHGGRAAAAPARPCPRTRVGEGVHAERDLLARAHAPDVGLVDGGVDLHLRQVVRDHEQDRRLERRGHRLAHVHVARDHDAVDGRRDDGVG